jgi:hypothetical protein
MNAAPDRRAVLGAVLAACATGATAALPASPNAAAPALSAIDRKVLNLWSERARLKATFDKLYAERRAVDDEDLERRCDDATNARCDVEVELNDHIGASVLGLAAVLIMEIGHDDHGWERIPRCYRAALEAIRPQLVGTIAEDADRVLARAEEEDA